MKFRHLLMALCLFAATQAGAVQIDRAQARIVADALIAINDNSSDDVPLAPYYIFSRGAGKGYVIVSGDDSTAPIVGYTEQGDFDEEQLPAPLKGMLKSWEEKINRLHQAQGTRQTATMTPEKARRRLVLPSYKSTWKDVPVLMSTHWNQGYPYNMLAPHRTDNGNQALTGCLATAASQIIYYFRVDNPTETLYDTPTYGYGGAPVTVSIPKGTPIRYDLMKLSGSGTIKQDSAVAVLMYVAGTSAWLTYADGSGTATSGQNSNMGDVLRGQFALNNDYCGKWSYSQQGWEKLVYDNLASGRPMLYTGANESQGGHAVVLDGYQASTGLYHFNFGWGGQGDGYFTIDDETGMNGFNSSQTMLCNITPKNQHYSANIIPPVLYERTNGEINVKVRNNATLPQSKFYLYCTANSTKPSAPSASDETTVVASGDSAIITFNYRPASARPLNIFLYDNADKLLDQTTVEVLSATPDLTLESISLDTSSDVTSAGGYAFSHLYNTTANVSVRLTNGANGTVCQPTLRCSVFEYDAETGTWAADSTVRSITSLQFQIGETCDTIFQFKGLKAGSCYKAHLVPVATTTSKFPIEIATPDSVLYFKVFAPTLSMTANGRHATVTGNWNPTLFAEAASDPFVTSYDLTAVEGISSQPVAANPNAIYYLSRPVDGLTNAVADGVCDNLVVVGANEFAPLAAFHANKATFRLAPFASAKWNVTSLPFAADVPVGMQARRITGISTVKLSQEHASHVSAAEPFAYLSSCPSLDTFTAVDVEVLADTIYSSLSDSIVVATVNTAADAKAMTLGEKSNMPYFLNADAGTPVLPFCTVLKTRSSSGIRLYSEATIDRYYTALADTLTSAYNALAANQNSSQYQQFSDIVAAYATAFTNYGYADYNAVKDAVKELGELIALFLSGGELPSGIEVIPDTESATATDSTVRYYSIDGTPLQTPRRGIVIVKQGNKVRKMVVRD